jgi:hypothetical protein
MLPARQLGCRHALVSLAALLALYIAHTPGAKGQTTSGTISGQVFDEAGKGFPDTKVVIVNELNSNTRAILTDQQGIYTFYFLSPGLYTITASHEGYTGNTVTHFEVPLNVITPIRPPDITLRPAGISTTTAPQPARASPGSSEGAPAITTTDATRRGNFVGFQLESLPLGGLTDMRTFDELAFLLPGVSPPPYTPGVRGPGVGFGIGTAGEFSVNGMRARSNNFTVDGSDNNDPDVGVRRQGFVARVPQSIESINEFEISTSLWDSELGRNFGSQVNAVSRDGGNQYHGQAYGFFTDSRLNARNFFDYTDGPSHRKDPFTRSQEGFVIGGPIAGNTTQFFGSFEHLDIHNSSEQHFATPTQQETRFLGLPRFAVLKPFSAAAVNQFFSTDRGATPLGANMLSFYPLPNNPGGPYGLNTFTQVLPADGRGDLFSIKVTHQFGQKTTVSARYNFTDDDRVLPAINRAINSTTRASTRTQDLSLIVDSQLGLRFFNNARFSYGRTRLGFAELSNSPLLFSASSTTQVGLPGGGQQAIVSNTFPIGELSIEPFSPVGVNAFTFPQARANNTFQYADTVSRPVGSHSIKFGGDIRRVQLNSLLDRNFRPQVVYGDALLRTGTLSAVADPNNPFKFTPESNQILSGVQLATLGLPSSIFQTITAGAPNSTIALRFTEYNFFFNDNWRVRKNFALDYGLRYEYSTVPHDANNRIEQALSLANLPAAGGSPADTPARTIAFNQAVAAYRTVLAGRTQIYEPDRNNLGPHFGFAWDPWSDGKTSVRGGYGVYYDAILGAVVSQSRNVFPNQIPINVEPGFAGFDVFVLNSPGSLILNNGARGPIAPIPFIAPGALNQLGGTSADFVALIGALLIQNRNGGGLAFTLPDKNLRTPYAQEWHLTLEREISRDFSVSAAYVGSKGTKLTRLTTPNLGPNVTPSILLATKFTNFPPGFNSPPLVLADCGLQQNGKCSVEPGRPNPFLGAYQIFEDSASSNYHSLQVAAGKRYSSGYSFTVSYSWSHAIDDVSDVFPIAGAPILPQDSFNLRLERASANFDIRQRFVASLIWDLPFYKDSGAGVARWLGGWQLTGIFQANTGQPFTLNVPVDANFDGNLTDRPSTTNGLTFTGGHNRQRVAVAPGSPIDSFFVLGRDGAVGRNTARGDSFVNLDLALVKMFGITERQKLNFRAEFFNALNRANFGLPSGVIGAPGFGSAVETANPARLIQFALKYNF